MNKKKTRAAFILVLMCVLAGQALAQGSGTKFNSNRDDLTRISNLLEEFRQDIIHKDGYALTKLMLNPNVLFHSIDNQNLLRKLENLIPSSMGLARALWMDL